MFKTLHQPSLNPYKNSKLCDFIDSRRLWLKDRLANLALGSYTTWLRGIHAVTNIDVKISKHIQILIPVKATFL